MNPTDTFPHTTQLQLTDHALPRQNNVVQPAAASGPVEGGWEDIPHPFGSVADQGWIQDSHYVNVVNHGMEPTVSYVFPDVGPQGIAARGQPIAPENQEYDRFGYVPQYVARGLAPAQAHPFGHRVPAPGQSGGENIRRLASRYLRHPSSRVDMIRVERTADGGFKVVIILEASDVL